MLNPFFGICRLDAEAGMPGWALQSRWHSVTRTADEVSVVCEAADIPAEVVCGRDWRGFRVAGTLDFSLTGILAAVGGSLADAGISLFAVSSFDTDYFFVKTVDLQPALDVLDAGGAWIFRDDAAIPAKIIEVAVAARNIAPVLTGDRITLRRPKRGDIADRIRIGRQAEFVRMCGGDTCSIPIFDEAAGEDWYRHILTVPYEWIIDLNGHCIGVARLTLTECDNRARYAVALFDSALYGQGLGTEVTRLVLRFAFQELKLHRVDLNVLTYNRRAIACYEKCGFIAEGVDREDALIEGQWASDMRMGILEDEWRAGC